MMKIKSVWHCVYPPRMSCIIWMAPLTTSEYYMSISWGLLRFELGLRRFLYHKYFCKVLCFKHWLRRCLFCKYFWLIFWILDKEARSLFLSNIMLYFDTNTCKITIWNLIWIKYLKQLVEPTALLIIYYVDQYFWQIIWIHTKINADNEEDINNSYFSIIIWIF